MQECQASLQSAQQGVADRDQALDGLADELVAVSTAQEELAAARQQAEEQVRVGGEGREGWWVDRHVRIYVSSMHVCKLHACMYVRTCACVCVQVREREGGRWE